MAAQAKKAAPQADPVVDTQNPPKRSKVMQTDVARGLIMVEGAVPGTKGGWITVRDAVKKKLPEGVPKPGKFKLADNESTAPVAVGQDAGSA